MKSPEGWPRLKRDWTGLKVRLKRDVTNRGGDQFVKGQIMVINGYYCGVDLKELEKRPGLSHWKGVNRVSPNALELVHEEA